MRDSIDTVHCRYCNIDLLPDAMMTHAFEVHKDPRAKAIIDALADLNKTAGINMTIADAFDAIAGELTDEEREFMNRFEYGNDGKIHEIIDLTGTVYYKLDGCQIDHVVLPKTRSGKGKGIVFLKDKDDEILFLKLESITRGKGRAAFIQEDISP